MNKWFLCQVMNALILTGCQGTPPVQVPPPDFAMIGGPSVLSAYSRCVPGGVPCGDGTECRPVPDYSVKSPTYVCTILCQRSDAFMTVESGCPKYSVGIIGCLDFWNDAGYPVLPVCLHYCSSDQDCAQYGTKCYPSNTGMTLYKYCF